MIDFPNSPTVGQSFTAAGVTWVWDGVKWNVNNIAGSQFIIVSATQPTSPIIGSLWWDTIGGQLYVYYSDGTSAQWVTAINQGFGGLYLPIVGGILTGPLLLAADPTLPLGAATKEYVDSLNTTIPQNYPINSNRIINGDMRIDQRNNGAAGTATGYTCDRWAYALTQVSKLTWQRGSISTPGSPLQALGWNYYLTFTTTTAYTPIATDNFSLAQPIEADLIGDFAWGTSNAQPVTLSFWLNASVIGTYSGAIRNTPIPSTRSYPFTFNVTAVGWAKYSITIPGDTTGTWVLNGNAAGLHVDFDLGMGSNFRSAAGVWTSGNYWGVPGSVSPVATAGAIFQITGVKLEIGNVATEFNMDSTAKVLNDCQRYFQIIRGSNGLGAGYCATTTLAGISVSYKQTMRAAPTMAVSAGAGFTVNGAACTAAVSAIIGLDVCQVNLTSSGLGAGTGATANVLANNWLSLTAEL
jgi:hypothetical protein